MPREKEPGLTEKLYAPVWSLMRLPCADPLRTTRAPATGCPAEVTCPLMVREPDVAPCWGAVRHCPPDPAKLTTRLVVTLLRLTTPGVQLAQTPLALSE